MLKEKILTPKEFLYNVRKYYITYTDDYITTILKYKQQEKEDEKLEGLIKGEAPTFNKLKDFILKEILTFIDRENKKKMENKKVKVKSFKNKL